MVSADTDFEHFVELFDAEEVQGGVVLDLIRLNSELPILVCVIPHHLEVESSNVVDLDIQPVLVHLVDHVMGETLLLVR